MVGGSFDLSLDGLISGASAKTENENCPDGCVVGDKDCFCYVWYYDSYKPGTWK